MSWGSTVKQYMIHGGESRDSTRVDYMSQRRELVLEPAVMEGYQESEIGKAEVAIAELTKTKLHIVGGRVVTLATEVIHASPNIMAPSCVS